MKFTKAVMDSVLDLRMASKRVEEGREYSHFVCGRVALRGTLVIIHFISAQTIDKPPNDIRFSTFLHPSLHGIT